MCVCVFIHLYLFSAVNDRLLQNHVTDSSMHSGVSFYSIFICTSYVTFSTSVMYVVEV